MTVALPTGKIAPAPALLGQLANRTQLTAVNAFEKDTLAPTTALDTFGLTNVIVTGFSVKNVGLEDTEVKFGMDFALSRKHLPIAPHRQRHWSLELALTCRLSRPRLRPTSVARHLPKMTRVFYSYWRSRKPA